MNKIITLIFSSLLFFSCSKDSNSDDDSNNFEIITAAAQNILGTSVTLGGTVNAASPNFYSRGVCWDTSQNPTLNGFNVMQDELSQSGSFSYNVEDLTPNQTYYARAFVQQNDGNIVYGNQITFITSVPITTKLTSQIRNKRAVLNGNIVQSGNSSSVVGFFVSTDSNVNVNDMDVVANFNLIGNDDFEIEVADLDYDTIYYVKSYILNEGTYTLGNMTEFRTTGYVGPASGYVGYDKGEYSDGWRYLEIYPNEIQFNPVIHNGYYWGEYGVDIPNTKKLLGFGKENTQLIVNATSIADCAAKGCDSFSVNGFSDWFLPSLDEVLLFHYSFREIGISFYNGRTWSSSQYNANQAHVLDYDVFTNTFVTFPTNKEGGGKVLPVRRY